MFNGGNIRELIPLAAILTGAFSEYVKFKAHDIHGLPGRYKPVPSGQDNIRPPVP